MSDPGKHRRGDDWGPREVIALVIIVMSFILAAVGYYADIPDATVPAWVVGLVSGIGLYYFKNGKGG